jgi:hypothetical protein
MKWCCSTFQSRYEHAGQTGFAVLVGRDAARNPQFTVQCRAVDQDLESAVKPEIPTQIVSDMQIDYCPWCGRNLLKWYGKSVDALYRPNLKITY